MTKDLLTNNIDFTTMFSEAQKKLDRQFRSMDILREHAKIVLGTSAIIVSLFSTLKIANTTIKHEHFFVYAILVGLIALVYGILVVFNIKAISPETLNHAVKPDWDTYIETYLGKSEREILRIQVSAYLNAVSENEKVILNQRDLSKKINILLSLVVILILGASFIPLIP